MKIAKLSEIPEPLIIRCLIDSFADYLVPIPQSISYWQQRFVRAKVDYSLSYGSFTADGRLVGFIINCADQAGAPGVAYNTGTGVLPAYRGRGLVDQLYETAYPSLRAAGITVLRLEVIKGNDRGIL